MPLNQMISVMESEQCITVTSHFLLRSNNAQLAWKAKQFHMALLPSPSPRDCQGQTAQLVICVGAILFGNRICFAVRLIELAQADYCDGACLLAMVQMQEYLCVCVVWCGVVWCGVVWCGVVWCGVVWCGVVWCGVVWCGVVWCGVVWCVVLCCVVLCCVVLCVCV